MNLIFLPLPGVRTFEEIARAALEASRRARVSRLKAMVAVEQALEDQTTEQSLCELWRRTGLAPHPVRSRLPAGPDCAGIIPLPTPGKDAA